jgi:hypothetical protein
MLIQPAQSFCNLHHIIESDTMPTLIEHIDALTDTVLNSEHELDDALHALEVWLNDHAHTLTPEERARFSAELDRESENSDRSLIDSILKLHTARLLYRYDSQRQPTPPEPRTDYEIARTAFGRALRQSEEGINEARIDVAIANAHQLLGDDNANRHWLDAALERLPPLASVDLVALAQKIPAMPTPKMNVLQRIGVKMMGFNFERLAEQNRDELAAIGRMQVNQLVIMAHLIGISFETIHERQRARRAFRIAAHLIVRYNGLFRQTEADQLLDMAESLHKFEIEAAQVLAEQARALYEYQGDAEGIARAQSVLTA